MSLHPRCALLNDANPHLVNFLKHVRSGLTIEIDMRNDKELYYSHRARFNDLISTGRAGGPETASLFYYLNRTGYNGLCRFNKKGQFNVPFGSHGAIRYKTEFDALREAFAEWEFTCGDFEDLAVCKEDFVYADPPYDVQFTQYSKGGFTWGDQVRLAHQLAAHEGPVVASNQATERVVALYNDLGFTLRFLEAPRMISCNGDRTAAREILATRNV